MDSEQVKNYLKIDDCPIEEDMYIQELIDATELYIDIACGEEYKVDSKLVRLANLVQYKLISDLFDNRGSIENVKSDRIVETIFMKLSNFGSDSI